MTYPKGGWKNMMQRDGGGEVKNVWRILKMDPDYEFDADFFEKCFEHY